VARFSHEPRKTHATALKMIARYLEGTKTKGMQTLLKEIIPTITIPRTLTVNMITTVFEDNNGAISSATTHRVTSRTKHFNIKYHFFWDSVEKGDIVIERINSQEQKADILTKGLTKDTFEKIRCLIQGW